MVEINGVAQREGQIHADPTLLVPGRVLRRLILISQSIVVYRFVVIALLVFHISEVVGRHIILAEGKVAQHFLGKGRVTAASVSLQENCVYKTSRDDENTCQGDETADDPQHAFERREELPECFSA